VRWRVCWTVVSLIVVETLVIATALSPVVVAWFLLASLPLAPAARLVVFALTAGPLYLVFALTLMPVSAMVTRALGWRTPLHAEMRITDLEWPLLNWVRYVAVNQVVRVLAGQLLRGTPPWSAYLRLSGSRVGRDVYVNSLAVADYDLLEFGDGVVIGADAHIAGHTVERGVVKTAPVRFGPRVTVGVGSIVDIGVTVGAGCQIGALTFVPKHATLEADAVYVGVPARRIDGRRIRSTTIADRARRIS